ncbi:MAG TPA: MMPL family transporter [Phycicoccus elongatus]|nr:MMPL family transporter [Phycicoccus elongatus]
MATFLYRVGRWCADHVKTVIAAWLIVLAALGGGAATFGTSPTPEVTIPGSTFQNVLDHAATQIPEVAGGFGTVVVHSRDGAFTDTQKAALTHTFDEWTDLDQVNRVVDPFAAQAQLDANKSKLADAATQLDSADAQLTAGRTELDTAKFQLLQGQGLLAHSRAKDPADPGIPSLEQQLATGQEQLAAGEAQWQAGYDQYLEGRTAYQQGEDTVAAINGLRMVSSDGSTAIVQIQFDRNTNSVDPAVRERVQEIGNTLAASGMDIDYSVEITQDNSLVGVGEIVGLVLAGIVLVAMLGTLIAAGLPLAVAMIGVGVGLAAAMALTAFYEMNSMTPALALMLGLAVGIDYALFIVNRHRSQLLQGMDLRESIARAVGTSGSAVLFAGTTVVIALVALVLSGIPLLAQMGLVAAGTVAVAVLVALTFSPALLRIMGTRVVSRRGWRAAGFTTPGEVSTRVVTEDQHEEEHGGWYVRLITRRPWLTVLGVVALVGIIAFPALDLRLGLPGGGNEPADSTAYRAYAATAQAFGPGMNGPVIVVADLPGTPTQEQVSATQAHLATSLAAVDGVEHVVPFGTSADHRTLAFQVVPSTGPAEAQTVTTVHALLDSASSIGASTGTTIGLTGQTVANIEISERLAAALPTYLLVVVGLSLLILTAVFRSVVVPLVATAGFLLSVATAFGATVMVYQWGWLGSIFGVHDPGPILSFMPIMLIGVLFGLAMDYQMFLVSGMREAWSHGEDARTAVRSGFTHGAKVVTAAAVIMFAVFGGFVFSHLTMIRPMGFGLAVGVLTDAVLVRMTLTPAVMHLLGERAWYMPGWLDRLTPDLDVEGTSLSAMNDAQSRPLDPLPA